MVDGAFKQGMRTTTSMKPFFRLSCSSGTAWGPYGSDARRRHELYIHRATLQISKYSTDRLPILAKIDLTLALSSVSAFLVHYTTIRIPECFSTHKHSADLVARTLLFQLGLQSWCVACRPFMACANSVCVAVSSASCKQQT